MYFEYLPYEDLKMQNLKGKSHMRAGDFILCVILLLYMTGWEIQMPAREITTGVRYFGRKTEKSDQESRIRQHPKFIVQGKIIWSSDCLLDRQS